MTLQKSSPFPPRPFSSLPFPFLSPCLAVEKGRGLRREKGTGEEEGKLWNPFPRKEGEETWEVPRHRLRTGEAPSTSFFVTRPHYGFCTLLGPNYGRLRLPVKAIIEYFL